MAKKLRLVPRNPDWHHGLKSPKRPQASRDGTRGIKKMRKLDAAIAKIRANRGLSVQIAKALKIRKAAVYQWRQVPGTRVLDIAKIIDMPPEKIRPDIFRKR
jgi:hypothetical protein